MKPSNFRFVTDFAKWKLGKYNLSQDIINEIEIPNQTSYTQTKTWINDSQFYLEYKGNHKNITAWETEQHFLTKYNVQITIELVNCNKPECINPNYCKIFYTTMKSHSISNIKYLPYTTENWGDALVSTSSVNNGLRLFRSDIPVGEYIEAKFLVTITKPIRQNITNSITLSASRTREALLITLKDLQATTTTKTLTIGSTNLAKLTDEDKKIATDKGWTLS